VGGPPPLKARLEALIQKPRTFLLENLISHDLDLFTNQGRWAWPAALQAHAGQAAQTKPGLGP